MNIRRSFVTIAVLSNLLSAPCFSETANSDTSQWVETCMGYFMVKTPAGLDYTQELSTQVDFNYIEIRHDFAGTAEEGIIEEVIKANPEQWFWMHDRWRIAK